MRFKFHDVHFNLNSKDKSPSCECQSKGVEPSPLQAMNQRNASFWVDRDASPTLPDLEAEWDAMAKRRKDKIARALAKDSPTEGLRAMNDANRSFWAARGVR